MFADQFRTAIAATPVGPRLDDLCKAAYQALLAGALTDDDLHDVTELIDAKRMAFKATEKAASGRSLGGLAGPVQRLQRPRRRPESIARRRRLAASGPLPPQLAAQFTTGEQAVLRIVGDEDRDNGCCERTLGEIAARAGVCRKLAQNTIHKARRMGLLAVEERRRPGRPSLPNVVKVISREWRAWLARGPRRAAQPLGDGEQGGGGKKVPPTDTRQKGLSRKEGG